MTKLDWKLNIENLAVRVAETYGLDVVEWYLQDMMPPTLAI